MRVIHDAEQRLVGSGVGEQRQDCEADEEAVGRGSGNQPERSPQGLSLSLGEPLDSREERQDEPVQRGISEFALRFDPSDASNAEIRCRFDGVVEQCRLAHPRVAA